MAYLALDIAQHRSSLVSAINNVWNMPVDRHENADGSSSAAHSYVRDKEAEARTAVDVKELPKAYVFIADMPGLKSADIKVEVSAEVENKNVLTISGDRNRDERAEDVKYIQLERNAGKFLRKFKLPANADLDDITAASSDGILTVTITKLPPPEPYKPRIINVSVSGPVSGSVG